MGRLSVREAAERLGVTPTTVLRYIHDGRLKAERIGERVWAVRAEDVAALPPPGTRGVGRRWGGARLSVAEAADVLGVSRAAVYERIARGRLQAERDGRRLWLARADIEAWARERAERAAGAS